MLVNRSIHSEDPSLISNDGSCFETTWPGVVSQAATQTLIRDTGSQLGQIMPVASSPHKGPPLNGQAATGRTRPLGCAGQAACRTSIFSQGFQRRGSDRRRPVLVGSVQVADRHHTNIYPKNCDRIGRTSKLSPTSGTDDGKRRCACPAKVAIMSKVASQQKSPPPFGGGQSHRGKTH